MDKGARIFVAGHRGPAGSALCQHLEAEGYQNLVVRNLVVRTRAEVDLCNQAAVDRSRKLLDVTRLNAMGWQARISLRPGLEETWRWYSEHRCDHSRRVLS